MIDKEIERSMLSNPSMRKKKQQLNKSKLEHEGASAISQTISDSRDFAAFRNDIIKRLQSILVDLVENFDEEFPGAPSASSTALGIASDTLLIDNDVIAGTSIALSDIGENRQSGVHGCGGGSSAYNVSYESDSENSYTNGSIGRHVCFE